MTTSVSRPNRRRFIKVSSLALGNGFLNFSVAGEFNILHKNREKINIGIIGVGSRGSGLMKIFERDPNVNVRACCDILPWRLKNAIEKSLGTPKSYSDYRFILDDDSIEAIVIATPLSSHYKILVDALESGKHVYCEKTMVYDSIEASSIVDKIGTSSKLIFRVGYQYRYSTLFNGVRKLIQSGSIGSVTSFECQWNRNGDWRRESPAPEYDEIVNWRLYNKYSRGLLGELSSHQIDFVNWVTASHPESVVGTGGIDFWRDGRETFDNINVIFNYPRGIKASFICKTASSFDGFLIKILGTKAAIVLKPDEAWIYPEEVDKIKDEIDGVTGATVSTINPDGGIPINVHHSNPTEMSIKYFINNIINENRKDTSINILSGYNATKAVEIAISAIKSNKRVYW